MNVRTRRGLLLGLAIAGWTAVGSGAARTGLEDEAGNGEPAEEPLPAEVRALRRAQLEEGLIRAEKSVVLLGELELRRALESE